MRASPYGFANSVFTGVDRALRALLPRDALRHPQPQPLDQPRQPAAAVRRRGQERQLPPGRLVGAPQRGRAGRGARERARRGPAAPARSPSMMPPPDLDRLDAQHGRRGGGGGRAHARRHAAPARSAPAARRRAARERTAGCAACTPAIAWCEEKKPPVFDHLRSAGPVVRLDRRRAARRARRHEPDRDPVRRLRRGSPSCAATSRASSATRLVRRRRHRARRDRGRGRGAATRCASWCPAFRTSRSSRRAPRPTRRRWRCAGSTRAARAPTRCSRSRAASTAARCSTLHATHPPQARAVRARRLRGNVRAVPGVGHAGRRAGRRRAATTPRPAPATSPSCRAVRRCEGRRAARRRGRVARRRRTRRSPPASYFARHRRADAVRGRRSLRHRAVLPRAAPADPPPRRASSSTRSRSASAWAARSRGTRSSACSTCAASPTTPTR